ncbi:MAG TPA: glycosyltransferase [Gemmatimonadaceae bacterium]
MSIVALGFWISLAICVWVYAGYPAVLAILAVVRSRPIRRSSYQPRITVIIPVHNRGEVIERKVRATLANGYPHDSIEVVVASDGSTDDTDVILRRLDDPRVRFLPLPRRGKAAAIDAAMAVATGEIIVFTDPDTQLDTGALSRLVRNFADPSVGGVAGRKVLTGSPGAPPIRRGRRLVARLGEWQTRLESRIGSTASAHGALHAMRRELYVPLSDTVAVDDAAVAMRLPLQGWRLVHDPLAVACIVPPVEPRAEFARKVRMARQCLRAVRGLGSTFRAAGFYSVTLTHRLLRCYVPVFMLVMLITSASLALDGHRQWQYALLLQALFYAAAAVPLFRKGKSRRDMLDLFTIPHYFCVSGAASLVALLSLIVRRGDMDWTTPELQPATAGARAGRTAGSAPRAGAKG